MENMQGRRNTIGIPRSPRLLRSKSGTPTISLPEIHPLTTNSGRKSVDRSKSTTRARTNKDEENQNPSLIIPRFVKKPQDNLDKPAGNSQRHRSSDVAKSVEMGKTKRTKSVFGSPSAWALSPGRSSPTCPMQESPDFGKAKVKSSAVNSVLKYFRQKKASPIQEEGFHQLRILHTRLVQWRFVNARAETALASRKWVAEERLFAVRLRIYHLRNSIVERRIQMQKLKHETKAFQIIIPQIFMLNDWGKIEKRNSEAVARLARKLSATFIRLPLINGAKADDMASIQKAMHTAMGVMNSIEEMITKFVYQVEITWSLTTELMNTMKQERDGLEELRKRMAILTSLEAQEKSLRVHLIQAAKESQIR